MVGLAIMLGIVGILTLLFILIYLSFMIDTLLGIVMVGVILFIVTVIITDGI